MKSRVQIHWVTNGENTKGWLHTHGMDKFKLPELEVRDIPAFLAESAAGLLHEVCDYMLDSGKVVRLGETMATSPRTRFLFVKPEPILGEADHYEVERWQIVDVETCCDCCRLRPSDQN